jgi:hypothetical protein
MAKCLLDVRDAIAKIWIPLQDTVIFLLQINAVIKC